MDGQQLLDRANALDPVLQQRNPVRGRDGSSLLFWAALNLGTARLGRAIIRKLPRPGGLDEVQRLLGAEPFDVFEAGALSITARSVVTAMDLCARSLYALLNGPQLRGGHEADVGTWN
jgi:hypothetical protein